MDFLHVMLKELSHLTKKVSCKTHIQKHHRFGNVINVIRQD